MGRESADKRHSMETGHKKQQLDDKKARLSSLERFKNVALESGDLGKQIVSQLLEVGFGDWSARFIDCIVCSISACRSQANVRQPEIVMMIRRT